MRETIIMRGAYVITDPRRVSPHDPNVLYAALSPAFSSSDGGIFRSDDVGKT